MKKLLLSFFFMFLLSNCEITSNISAKEIEDVEQERICKSEKVMGSKIPQTTCYTKEELERLEEKSRKILEKEQRTRQQMKTMGSVKPE